MAAKAAVTASSMGFRGKYERLTGTGQVKALFLRGDQRIDGGYQNTEKEAFAALCREFTNKYLQ